MAEFDPQEILKPIHVEDLEVIANKVNIKIPKKKKGNEIDKDLLVKELVALVREEGIKRVFAVLKQRSLQHLVSLPAVDLYNVWTPPEKKEETKKTEKKPVENKKDTKKGKKGDKKKEPKNIDDKPYPAKQMMLKIISDYCEKNVKDIRDFFEKYSTEALKTLCKDIDDLSDMDESELNKTPKEDFVNAIMSNVNSFGLNHLFQTLTVDELLDIADNMDLKVKSQSKEVLIDSIFEQKDYKPKKRKTAEPSDKRPEISSKITKVDLTHWYSRKELEAWLKAKGATSLVGKKANLVDRVYNYYNGDEERSLHPKSKGKRSRSKSPAKGKKDDESSKKRKLNEKDEESN